MLQNKSSNSFANNDVYGTAKFIPRRNFNPSQEAFCQALFDIGVIKFGEFRLKLHDLHPEAPPSPIYLDLRILRRFPEAKQAAVDVYLELLSGLTFDILADVPTAATPFVSSLSDRLHLGMITPRADSKTHGGGAKADGYLTQDAGKTAVVIDDLVTQADSKITAIRILEELGLKVTDVVVLIDREQGGKEQLANQGYTLHSAITLPQILDALVRNSRISPQECEHVINSIQAMKNYFNH